MIVLIHFHLMDFVIFTANFRFCNEINAIDCSIDIAIRNKNKIPTQRVARKILTNKILFLLFFTHTASALIS